MKIAFIFGKGIDGCGVTKGAHIYEDWLRKNGHDTIVVAFNNGQKFARAKYTIWKGPLYTIEETSLQQEIDSIATIVDSCDIAIFHSHPTRKQFAYVDRYREFVTKIKNPIVVIHDHAITKTNINAVPQMAELFSMADIGVIQSLDGFSKKAYTRVDPGISDRLIENPIWVFPNQYDQYRKSFEDRRKHFMYIGRMSSIKDPAMIPRIEPYLNDWELSLIGCEKSIASVTRLSESLETNPSPYVPEFIDKICIHNLNTAGNYNTPNLERKKINPTINAYCSYKYEFGMSELGSSFASWCGYRLKDNSEYGHRMEYTMIESYLLTLPVISVDFSKNAYSPEGKLWGEYDCTLISEARQEKELADRLKSIRKNEWNDRTTACQELIYKFNNIDVIGQAYLDFIIAKGKRNDKINFIDAIRDYFPSAAKYRNDGKILVTSANGVVNKIPAILNEGRQTVLKEIPQSTTLDSFL